MNKGIRKTLEKNKGITLMVNEPAPAIAVAETSINSNDVLIADAILEQIEFYDPIGLESIACTPEKCTVINRGILMNGVIVQQTSRTAYGNIEITLNGGDLYDIVGYSTNISGQPKRVVFEYNDVYFNRLWEKLRKIWE